MLSREVRFAIVTIVFSTQLNLGEYDLPSDIGPIEAEILRGCINVDVTKRWDVLMVEERGWGVGWVR